MRFTQGSSEERSENSDCISQSFGIFNREPVDDIIIDRRQCEAQTSSGIQGSGPFEIIIHSEKKTYIDPTSIRVNASFRIRKKNASTKALENIENTPTAVKDITVAPINQLSKSIFKSVEVELENTPISLNASDSYAVESYISTMLSYNKSAVNKSLRCSYFVKDTPGEYDNLETNVGAQERSKWLVGSPPITVCDSVNTELTSSSRYIVPGVSIKFRFIVDKPAAFLITKLKTDEYAIEFNDISITYDRVLIREELHNQMEKELLVTPARYVVGRNEIRTKAFPTGLTSLQWNNAYQGTLPDAVGIFMNSLEAADSEPTKNIFNFQHFGMNECSMWVNSRKVTAKDLAYDFTGKDVIRAFRHFWDNVGDAPGMDGSMVEYADFLDGFCCAMFDLTGNRTAMYRNHFQPEGTISVDIKLKTASSEPINMYFIAFYKEEFFIYGPNENRRVSFTKPKKI